MFTAADHEHMAEALKLARRGLWTTDPNPRVGCRLVKNGRVVGQGWHQRAGGPHAEINALREAGEEARGATAFVTLEPCSHHGRTPPCVEALIGAGVARVIAAMEDPNPAVRGAGLKALTAAGIETESGLLCGEAEALNPGFVSRMVRGRPWFRSKLAASLDGRTALASGESRWITGGFARADGHRLRARSSAILTGSGTVLADDPALTVRLGDEDAERRQPYRIVLDSRLRTPPGARLFGTPGGAVHLLHAGGADDRVAALRDAGASVTRIRSGAGGIDLAAVCEYLVALECNEVLVEAGPRLNGALLTAGLLDELVVYVAPCLLGDAARGLFNLPWLTRMPERPALQFQDLRRVGADLRITLRPREE